MRRFVIQVPEYKLGGKKRINPFGHAVPSTPSVEQVWCRDVDCLVSISDHRSLSLNCVQRCRPGWTFMWSVCECLCVYVFVCVCLCACMSVCLCVRMHACLCACARTGVRACMHACVRIRMRVRVHVCMRACVRVFACACVRACALVVQPRTPSPSAIEPESPTTKSGPTSLATNLRKCPSVLLADFVEMGAVADSDFTYCV